jgi:hypothetical protein
MPRSIFFLFVLILQPGQLLSQSHEVTLAPPLKDITIYRTNDDLCGEYYNHPEVLYVATFESLPRTGRGLVKFDIHFIVIPSGVNITSAKLQLYCFWESEYVDNECHVSLLLEDWSDAEANWCARTSALPWCENGGCFALLGQSTVIIPSKYPGDWDFGEYNEWIEWDVTNIVNYWREGTYANHGFCVWQEPMYGHDRNQSLSFASMEHSQALEFAPKLILETDDDITVLLPDSANRSLLCGATPNPFNPSTSIQLDLPVPGRATICIFDPVGRLVRILSFDELPSGNTAVFWDGRDDLGRNLASGIYLFYLDTAFGTDTGRATLLK